jgi:hypothetical protein
VKIATFYSHLNGWEWIKVHRPGLWEEIESIIVGIDASKYRTKISKEKTMKGKKLYSPVELNARLKTSIQGRTPMSCLLVHQVNREGIGAVSDYDGPKTVLRDILEDTIPEKFFLESESLDRWHYLKGAKKEPRVSKSGHAYTFSEGAVAFPDSLDKPGRTILTAEGGSGPSRFRHVIECPHTGLLRRLTLLFIAGRLHFYDVQGKRASGNSGGPSVLIAYGDSAAISLAKCGIPGSFAKGWKI